VIDEELEMEGVELVLSSELDPEQELVMLSI
jgi:hypothetical protein